MRFVYSLLAAALCSWCTSATHAGIRIVDDRGGLIETYVSRIERLRASGESVIIDGLCASACTMILAAVQPDKICVTSRAALGFHAAYQFAANGRTVPDHEATTMLYLMYPAPVKRWIIARGGLTPHMIFLRGRPLRALYQPCSPSEER
jgi:hypothetical protein